MTSQWSGRHTAGRRASREVATERGRAARPWARLRCQPPRAHHQHRHTTTHRDFSLALLALPGCLCLRNKRRRAKAVAGSGGGGGACRHCCQTQSPARRARRGGLCDKSGVWSRSGEAQREGNTRVGRERPVQPPVPFLPRRHCCQLLRMSSERLSGCQAASHCASCSPHSCPPLSVADVCSNPWACERAQIQQ